MDISAKHKDTTQLLAFYKFIDAVLAGEESIKAAKTAFLPMTAGMKTLKSQIANNDVNATDDDVASLYEDLVARAQFPSWVEEAVVIMVGLIARVTPVISLPERLQYLQENSTNDGFSIVELFQRVCYHLLRYGKVSLVADVDADGKGYIALYEAGNEYNWLHSTTNGRKDLTMVAFLESELNDPTNPFSTESTIVRRAYILRDRNAEVWVSKGEEKEATLYSSYLGMPNRPLTYLPVVRLSAINNISESSNPPLLPLCRAAIKSYQLSADLFSALHRSCHPQLYVTGVASSPLSNQSNPNSDGNRLKNKQLNYTGAGTVWTLPLNSVVNYAEPQGTGMSRVSEEMAKQKSAALEAGAKVMDIGVESGEAREARQNDQYATLYSIVQNAAKGVEQVLRYLFDMTSPIENKTEETSIRFEVPVDFGRHTVDGTLAAHLLTAAERGAISFDTYWTYLTTGKLPERTLLEEITKASSENIKLKPITGMVQTSKQGDAS
mgnify:CR=1 FL=1